MNQESEAPHITLGTVLEATRHCETREAFSAFLVPHGFCYGTSAQGEGFGFSTHVACGTTSMGDTGVRVNFAVSADGGLNSSLTTKNEVLAQQYQQELQQHAFAQMEPQPVPARGTWYQSEQHPHVGLMWEELTTPEGAPLWHIGVVWRPRTDGDAPG